MPLLLHSLGYEEIFGVDLNEDVVNMPFNDSIKYSVADFKNTFFKSNYFSAITAISVIEHGFESDRLLAEVSRLLKVGGYFIVSVDYWKDKISTDGLTAFGMDWMIFPERICVRFLMRRTVWPFSSRPH